MSGRGWKEISRETCVDSPYLKVYREVVATPTRPEGIEWTVVRRKQAVVVAPRTPEGQFYLIRQERIAIRKVLWEFPAGQIDGVVDEASILESVHRELGEETGCETSDPLVPAGTFWSSAGFTDERAHLFLATNVRPRLSGSAPDEHEAILDCRTFSPDALRGMIAAGEIEDANTLSLFARLSVMSHI